MCWEMGKECDDICGILRKGEKGGGGGCKGGVMDALTLSKRCISLRSIVNADPVTVEWSGTSRLSIYDIAPSTSTGLTLRGGGGGGGGGGGAG